jgi:hypothetical protein
MNCGTVLYDKAFQFPNGETIDKLLIVLCEFGTDHLVLTTTGQQHTKQASPGCQIKDKPPTYFLPQGSCWFDRNTWVQLHVIYELDSTINNYKKSDGTVIEHKNALPLELMKGIIDCALQSKYIEQFYLDILKGFRAKMP